MTVYAFFMTLLVGIFIGTYLTVAVALKIETRRKRKEAAEVESMLEVVQEQFPDLYNKPFPA